MHHTCLYLHHHRRLEAYLRGYVIQPRVSNVNVVIFYKQVVLIPNYLQEIKKSKKLLRARNHSIRYSRDIKVNLRNFLESSGMK